MKGDFSRLNFKPANNYLAVLKQQGRVDLDSDWNEQSEIFSEYNRQLVHSILGGFAVIPGDNDISDDNSGALKVEDFTIDGNNIINFKIGKGIAYIGGYQFRIENDMLYSGQPDYPQPESAESGDDILIYIEVWKKAIGYIDDELIREPALGGPDTTLRMKLIGQVKILTADKVNNYRDALDIIKSRFTTTNLRLTLKIDQSSHQMQMNFGEIDMGGGLIPGNLHYRIELHRGVGHNGGFEEGFKWSDENASMVVKVVKNMIENSLLVEESEGISGESFKEGEWVEISNVITEYHRQGSQMARIKSLVHGSEGLQLTLDSPIHPLLTRQIIQTQSKEAGKGALRGAKRGGNELILSPRIRRWSGYIPNITIDNIYDLGRGVKAKFTAADKNLLWEPSDYWCFAVRDREFNKKYAPNESRPHGIKKYRYPLAIINRSGKKVELIDCRRLIKPLEPI